MYITYFWGCRKCVPSSRSEIDMHHQTYANPERIGSWLRFIIEGGWACPSCGAVILWIKAVDGYRYSPRSSSLGRGARTWSNGLSFPSPSFILNCGPFGLWYRQKIALGLCLLSRGRSPEVQDRQERLLTFARLFWSWSWSWSWRRPFRPSVRLSVPIFAAFGFGFGRRPIPLPSSSSHGEFPTGLPKM